MTKHDRQRVAVTDKRQAFAREYLVDLNATAAAIRAGYSPSSAKQHASDLMQVPEVREEIERALAARARRTGISADRVVRELARLAFADQRDFVEWGPDGVRLLPSEQLHDDAAPAIAAIERTKDGAIRIRFHDKVRALELLGRHLGLWRERDPDQPQAIRVVVVASPHGSTIVPTDDHGEVADMADKAGE